MLKIILVDAFPRILSLSLAPLSLYLLSSSFRLSKSHRRVIIPYFVSTPILSLGLIMPCGSVSALIALVSDPQFATKLLLVDSLILSLISQLLTLGAVLILSPIILNKLMGNSIKILYHTTYTNTLVAITTASCATELSSLVINNTELSAIASPILCVISSFGPIPLLVLLFVSSRTEDSTPSSKRMRAPLTQLGLSQVLGCTSSALKVIKPSAWVLFSIRMVVLLRTALSMLTFHVLIRLRVGRPSSDVSFNLRPPSQPIDLTGYQDHDSSRAALPLQRPRTHLSRNSQASFPKSGDEIGWKWPGPPQRLLVLEPVRTVSVSTVGERTSFNDITKKPEMDPFGSTRPNSFDGLRVDPQPPSQPCIDPKHELVIQPESQEATPRASEAHNIDS